MQSRSQQESQDVAGALRAAVVSVALGSLVLELRYHYSKRKLAKAAERESSAKNAAQIILGSGSALKRAAVERSLEDAGLAHATVKSFDVSSGVNDQPVGNEETLKGARCRAQSAIECWKKEEDSGDKLLTYAIGIESGIVCVDEAACLWMDVAWIVIVDMATNREFVASSAGVPLPREPVEEALRMGVHAHTVGQRIAASVHGSSCDSRDPHRWITAGLVDRERLLTSALLVAWGAAQKAGQRPC